ncbi:hypothetical protein QYE76_067803 [Lolium multiflorum]|uniref:Protein kinase domain-containing protein n=1 Tax=Lolium multiflorum TaxID=4521 RepID=A0AAD8WBB2_LOLMU|nr:hypothetical protein QYE76_067803 [Lolium multiflorum]
MGEKLRRPRRPPPPTSGFSVRCPLGPGMRQGKRRAPSGTRQRRPPHEHVAARRPLLLSMRRRGRKEARRASTGRAPQGHLRRARGELRKRAFEEHAEEASLAPGFSSSTIQTPWLNNQRGEAARLSGPLDALAGMSRLQQAWLHGNQFSGPIPVQVLHSATKNFVQVLRSATKNYAQDNVLGRGGFGVVYKGLLHDGTMIAVKRMESSVISNKALDEFQAEIAILTKVRHRNLVSILGYSIEGNERLLLE